MSISGLLNQTITIYGIPSYDGYSSPSFGSGTSVKARFQPQTKRKLVANGDVITIDAIAYVPASTSVETDNKVNYSGNDYRVLTKYPTPGRTGTTEFIKLELVKWQI